MLFKCEKGAIFYPTHFKRLRKKSLRTFQYEEQLENCASNALQLRLQRQTNVPFAAFTFFTFARLTASSCFSISILVQQRVFFSLCTIMNPH